MVHVTTTVTHTSAGATSLFIRILLDKKYTLPYQVLDALVFHFIRISNTHKTKSDPLPVLWHQSLLVFCQRYGVFSPTQYYLSCSSTVISCDRYSESLTQDQKNALLDVVRVHAHPQISPEVRRELATPIVRGDARPEDQMDLS